MGAQRWKHDIGPLAIHIHVDQGRTTPRANVFGAGYRSIGGTQIESGRWSVADGGVENLGGENLNRERVVLERGGTVAVSNE